MLISRLCSFRKTALSSIAPRALTVVWDPKTPWAGLILKKPHVKDFFFPHKEFLHFCSNYSGLMASDSCQCVTLVSDRGAAISYQVVVSKSTLAT